MNLKIKSEFLGSMDTTQQTQADRGMDVVETNVSSSEWVAVGQQFEEVSTETVPSMPVDFVQQNMQVNCQPVYYQTVPTMAAYYSMSIDVQSPQLELQQNVKSSQACHDAGKGVLTADVREIPVVISHPQLFNYTKLIVRFSNYYDKTAQYIDLSARGPCPHDHEQFMLIRGDYSQSIEINDHRAIEYTLPNNVRGEGMTQMTVFLDFKHSTTCYKKSNQSCFKIQRTSSKSPIFRAQFILVNEYGPHQTPILSEPLELLLKVVRNVTRELEKMTKPVQCLMSGRKRKTSSTSSEESGSNSPPASKVRYAESDDFFVVSINKDNLREYEFWKRQINYFQSTSASSYQYCGTDITSIIQ